MAWTDLLKQVLGMIQGQKQKMVSPVPDSTPTPTPDPWIAKGFTKTGPNSYSKNLSSSSMMATPTPSPAQPQILGNQAPDNMDLARKLQAGFAEYLHGTQDQGKMTPILDYLPQFIQAAQKYPFLKNNPYLAPAISILETSAGRNITRPNNLLNWAINYPGNNEAFAQMTMKSVLDRALSGLGERDPNYTSFRTGKPMTPDEIMGFANKYEPANGSYGPNLQQMIQTFERQ